MGSRNDHQRYHAEDEEQKEEADTTAARGGAAFRGLRAVLPDQLRVHGVGAEHGDAGGLRTYGSAQPSQQGPVVSGVRAGGRRSE